MSTPIWESSGWRPADIRVIQLYDGSTVGLLLARSSGVLPGGEAWQFIQDGRIKEGGDFPLLSGGGNLGWGRIHGVPHILECYLQLSGRAGERQIAEATTGYRATTSRPLGGDGHPLQLRRLGLIDL